MRILFEVLVRGAFLFGIACFTVFGLLFGGFASDGGRNPTATIIGLSVLLFAILGGSICLSSKQFLFSNSNMSKALWGAFALSAILPFLVLFIAVLIQVIGHSS